jgi:hypothetical protein
LALSNSKCVLTHIVHGGDRLTVKPGDAPKSTISAPWYMELKFVGDHVKLPAEPDAGLLWSLRQAFDLKTMAAIAQPETGGPVMFCPQAAIGGGTDGGGGTDDDADSGLLAPVAP